METVNRLLLHLSTLFTLLQGSLAVNYYKFDKILTKTSFSVDYGVYLYSTSSQTLKLILSAALLLITLLACGLPILLIDCLMRKTEVQTVQLNDSEPTQPLIIINDNQRSSNWQSILMKTWISRISCFAGGVFLAAGLMDLFPDVCEAFDQAKASFQIQSEYPFPSLFTLLGFFLIFTMEQGISVMHKHHSADNHNGQHHHQNFGQALDSMSIGSIEEVVEHNGFKTFSLLFAISLHSVFEGLAVGLQPTYNQTLSIFLALIIHKIIIGFSIGINLAKFRVKSDGATNIPHKKTICIQVACALLFSFATPIGILIGWGLIGESNSPALQMTTAILQGIACGTFLFIVFCEILPDEFREGSPDRIIKLIFAFFGFILIAIYIFFLPA